MDKVGGSSTGSEQSLSGLTPSFLIADLTVYGRGSASKRELVARLGAVHIDYAKEDFVERLQAKGGYDAIFNYYSQPTQNRNIFTPTSAPLPHSG